MGIVYLIKFLCYSLTFKLLLRELVSNLKFVMVQNAGAYIEPNQASQMSSSEWICTQATFQMHVDNICRMRRY